MAFADLASVTNAEFWNAARDADVNFASHTSKVTSDFFTERGFEALSRTDLPALNEWVGLSVRVAFQKLTAARARNPLEASGIVEAYDDAYGRYIQRITVNGIKPVSPRYRGLKDFDSVDPFVIKKVTAQEQFYTKNFDYQALLTIQDFQIKEIFLAERGMGEYLAALMQALDNAYMLQRYENALEVMNAALNSTKTPLRDTQIAELDSWTAANPTAAELTALITYLKDIASAMSVSAQTSAFNANGFKTVVDPSDCVLLLRPGIKNRIATALLVGAFNPDQLSLPFEVREIENFGGLQPFWNNGSADQTAYPVYDALGSEIGFATTKDASATDLTEDQVAFKDPNADVLGLIVQKGAFFETIQNAYTVRTIYNPRGLYENYWASAPNNAISYDANYAMIAIKTPTA